MEDCLEWLLLDEDEKRLEAGLERPEDVQEVVGVKRHRGDSLISRVMGPGGPECLISGGPSAAIFFCLLLYFTPLCWNFFTFTFRARTHKKKKQNFSSDKREASFCVFFLSFSLSQ